MAAADDWIDVVTFPVSKLDLIDAASDAEVPQETIERLQQLGAERYESRAELEAELAADV